MTFSLLYSLAGYKEAFAKFSEYRIDSRGIKYDYESVMHYGGTAFSKNGKPTIQARQSGVHQLGNTKLSALDIQQANLLYGCDSKYTLLYTFSYLLSQKILLKSSRLSKLFLTLYLT